MTTGDALGRMDSDTDADAAPDTDDRDIRARVAELEATVAQQQETISQLLPSRRRVLQAGGLVAGGGALGALSADRASADVVGQVGTDADRVDVFAGQVDANSVSTDTVAVGTDSTLLQSGTRIPIAGATPPQALSDTSSTSFESVGHLTGVPFDSTDTPSGATLYGRFVAQLSVPDGPDNITARPRLLNSDFSTIVELSELTVSSNTDGSDVADSGWTEITSSLPDDVYFIQSVQAKVSGGTGGFAFSGRRVILLLAWQIN